MAEVVLHHVSIITRDLERAAQFYENLFGLQRLPRPAFNIEGIWFEAGPSLQVHLVVHPTGTFRTGPVDNNDVHFAFRTTAFDAIVARLVAAGFREDAAPGDPMYLILKRTGAAGFPQLYVMDPDRNVIEVNGAT